MGSLPTSATMRCSSRRCVALLKREGAEARLEEKSELEVRHKNLRAVTSEGVIEVFTAAALDLSENWIFSEEFLAKLSRMPHRISAAELLHELLQVEMTIRLSQKSCPVPFNHLDTRADSPSLLQLGY